MARPAYNSKKGEPPAVRVYTVCDESRYLIVRNVPALGCIDELVKLFGLYGPIEEYRLLDEEECEPFTDVYWIKFVHINNARFAKRKLDDYKFLGNLLQVTYAPDYETVLDTKQKLEERRHAVLSRLNPNKQRSSNVQATRRPVESDPLLEPFSLPGSIHQYPKFPLEQLSVQTEQTDCATSQTSQYQDIASVGGMPSVQYFSSSSMNVTVQSVREKLDKISDVSLPNQVRNREQSHSKREFPGNDETSTALKKQQHDKRRRI